MTTLGEYAAHDGCTLVACLNPLHPGPCKGWKGTTEEAFKRTTRQSRKGIRAYNTARTVKGSTGSSGAARRALLSYVNGSGPINRSLRFSKGKGSNDPKIVAEIKAMDAAMAKSKLTHPITVQRALSPSAFGGKDTNIDLTGAEYVDHAFGSTGTDLSLILKHFHTTSSGKKPLIANITVPAGTGAIRVPPGQWGDEKEILLDRGSHFRVVEDHGYIDTPKGRFRHVSLEVVPGDKPKAEQVDLGEKNQAHRDSVTASGRDMAADCRTGEFCMQTHKPGLCKGQKRGESEPGAEDATKRTPAQVAQIAQDGLTKAIAQAQAVIAANPGNPKLTALARKAISGYQKALRPHQQTLKDAARENDTTQRTAERDTREQDDIDEREAKKKETLGKRAQAILDRRKATAAETKKLKAMTPKQRTAYRKAKAEKARKEREARENKIIRDAGKA